MSKSSKLLSVVLLAAFAAVLFCGIVAGQPEKLDDKKNDTTQKLIVTEKFLVKSQDIVNNSLILSPDSKRVAYIARGKSGYVVVVDGVNGKEYPAVSGLVFSPNSQRLAYMAGDGRFKRVVVNGVEERQREGIVNDSIVFSPDSTKVTYIARPHGQYVVVFDGVDGKEYSEIKGLVFRPDSQRVAYAAMSDRKRFVVEGVTEGNIFDEIGEICYSPRSEHLAYFAKQKGQWLVVVDGRGRNEYDGLIDESHLVFDSSTKLHTLMLRGGNLFRVEIEITH